MKKKEKPHCWLRKLLLTGFELFKIFVICRSAMEYPKAQPAIDNQTSLVNSLMLSFPISNNAVNFFTANILTFSLPLTLFEEYLC